MKTALQVAVCVLAVAVATLVVCGGTLIGWGNIGAWIGRWDWAVAVAVLAVIASAGFSAWTLRRSTAQFRQQREDARVDKLRAEIAALDTAVDEQRSVEEMMLPGMVEALEKAGVQTVISHPQMAPPTSFPKIVETLQQAVAVAKTMFQESVSPIYRRIAAHAFGVQMLTDDPRIIDPVKMIEENTNAIWHKLRDTFQTIDVSSEAVEQRFHRALTSGAPDMSESIAVNEFLKVRQAKIESARVELRAYCLLRFSKLEE